MYYAAQHKKYTIENLSAYALALFLFLTPFEYPLADLMSTSPLRLVGLFAMGLAVVDIIRQRVVKVDYRIILILAWMAYGLLSILWVSNLDRFRAYYSIYINNALMFVLFSMVSFSQKEAQMLKKSLIYGVGALILYMTFIPGAVEYSDYQHRLTLNAGEEGLDQNYLAALMIVSFGIVFYDLCHSKQKKPHKILSIVFCVAIVAFVVLTGSRSGIIAMLVILLLTVSTSWKTRFYIGVPVLILILVIVPIVSRYLPPELLDRFSISAITGQEGESETRLLIWARALDSLRNFNWVFGYGIGSPQTVIGNILGSGKEMAIHNHYIATVVELGIIGFLLINIPIFKMLKHLRKTDKKVSVAFMGILVIAFFIDVITTKFFWSAMILLSALCSSRPEKID